MKSRVNSIYIMLDDGRCIFNKYFTPAAPPKNLITGMFTALQGFLVELTGVYPTLLSTHKFTFYFQKRGPITIVLNTSNTMSLPPEIDVIGLKFLQKFGNEVRGWKGNDEHFDQFSEELSQLLGETKTIERIDPKEPLTPLSLLSLDEKYQLIVKELISKKEMSSIHIAEVVGDTEFSVRLLLEELVEEGFIGRYILNDDFYYFTQ